MAAAHPTPFIERLSLRNYKSIGECDVTFRPLTVIVGRNGSGKSNFLDSLHFISDALLTSLESAIRARGGAKAITHKRRGPTLQIAISFRLEHDRSGSYLLELDKGLVRREALTINRRDGSEIASYNRSGSDLVARTSEGPLLAVPSVLHDRLALVALSGTSAFRPVFDRLSAMRFYRLNPDAMRALQDPDDGEVLHGDGGNVASVWRRLEEREPALTERLTRYLNVIAPEIRGLRAVSLGPKETLNFYHDSGARKLMFHASDMSDGTLRALGALVASRQGNGVGATVVGIEEPENSIHPGAVAAIMDALHEGSAKTQIIVTSHSPDVLDQVDIDNDALLVTEMRDANTTVAGVDTVSREAVRRHLYTLGDLLRMDQLQPQEALPR